MAETVQVAGLVTARSESGTGIQINDGAWLNFTKPEYAKTPFEKEGAVTGARVVCQVKDGKWITTIKVLGDQPEEAERVPTAPGFDGEDRPEVSWGEPSQLERQRNRETALNAAARVGAGMAGDAEERGGKIIYLAGVFADWLAQESQPDEPEIPFE